jgi:hypothetical protein
VMCTYVTSKKILQTLYNLTNYKGKSVVNIFFVLKPFNFVRFSKIYEKHPTGKCFLPLRLFYNNCNVLKLLNQPNK